MSMRIFVGNLPFSATDEEVREMFREYGIVESVNLVSDRDTGRPRGFGFVEMSDGGNEAIEALHQREYGGRRLNVNEARQRTGRGDIHDRYRRR